MPRTVVTNLNENALISDTQLLVIFLFSVVSEEGGGVARISTPDCLPPLQISA